MCIDIEAVSNDIALMRIDIAAVSIDTAVM
jgi:hypothetical protein